MYKKVNIHEYGFINNNDIEMIILSRAYTGGGARGAVPPPRPVNWNSELSHFSNLRLKNIKKIGLLFRIIIKIYIIGVL